MSNSDPFDLIQLDLNGKKIVKVEVAPRSHSLIPL